MLFTSNHNSLIRLSALYLFLFFSFDYQPKNNLISFLSLLIYLFIGSISNIGTIVARYRLHHFIFILTFFQHKMQFKGNHLAYMGA